MDMFGDWSEDIMWSDPAAFNNTTAVDNSSFTCAARNIKGEPIMLPYSASLLTGLRVLHSIAYLIIAISGSFLNSLLITLIATNKKLQTLSFWISLQIVIMDLLLSVIICMSGFVNSVANQWVFGEHLCDIAGLMLVLFSRVRTLLMFVFVLDRFLSVFIPFHYPKLQVQVVSILSVVVWLFSLSVGLVQLSQVMDCYTYNVEIYLCTFSLRCGQNCALLFNLFVGFIVIPAILSTIVLYTILLLKAIKVAKAIPSTITSTHEKEKKAIITYFLLFISVIVTFVPASIVHTLITIFYRSSPIPSAFHVTSVICTFVFLLLPVTDPLVIMRHRDVIEAIKGIRIKLVKKCCPNFIKEQETPLQITLETLDS